MAVAPAAARLFECAGEHVVTLVSEPAGRGREPAAEYAHALFDLARDAMLALDAHGCVEYGNAAAQHLFGYPLAQLLGKPWHSLFICDKTVPQQTLWQLLLRNGQWEGDLRCRQADGGTLEVLSRWNLQRDAAGQPLRILVASMALAQWAQLLELTQYATKKNFGELFGQHPDGVFAFDLQGRLISANAALADLTGYSTQEVMSMPLSRLVKDSCFDPLRRCFRQALQGQPQTTEFVCIRKDGSELEVSISLLPNLVNDAIVGVHGILKDISERKSSERKILYLANHDALTGLPNRNLLHDRLEHAIDQARRFGSMVGLFFLDLNRFKIINDSLGHDKGDILLRIVAERLRKSARDIDTVARLGGDEFVVVIEHIKEDNHISYFADILLQAVCQPADLGGHVVSVSTSIGVSVYPYDGEEPYQLLKNADLAMYSAKGTGLGRFCLYEPAMNRKALERLLRENSLREAIERGQLMLHYQPRLNIGANRIVSVEALVRWDHPEKGLIYPMQFIDLAEETGMIDLLGEWVLLSACNQMRQWRDAGLHPMKVSINVSVQQLNSKSFCELVKHVIEESGLDAHYIELEITESTLMINLDSVYATLLRLKELGITLSIDDFGTGYSSLSYLKRLPIDTLKIDKAFVRDIGHDLDDNAIVNATIAMAHSMQLNVVAEGVMSTEQMDFLQRADCDEIQGYLLCQPLPPAEMETFFKTCKLRGIEHSWAH